MATKALPMSIVVKSVLCESLFELMPSKTCVRLVSKVFVEYNGRNKCCVGARGTSGWIMFSIRCSVILDGVQSTVLGLQDEGVVSSLFGLSIVMILACFQMFGIGQWA